MLKIEKVSLKDLDEICAFEIRVFDENNFRLSRNIFRYHLKKKTFFLKAILDKKIVGYLMLFAYKNKSSTRLYSIGVDQSFTRQKIASTLIEAAIYRSKKLGKNKIFLEVRQDNFAAIALYNKLGFVIIKELKGYYPFNGNGYKMALNL
ncbi:MAG: GNAT family N-acetyltransferase [Helicobacteraceae bacterium]|jgi:ribosomal protein S18 acetylase RimI-like enzyme|nr:GNAT family N-acetyltransferase [Helicobacteraceae bacterium]